MDVILLATTPLSAVELTTLRRQLRHTRRSLSEQDQACHAQSLKQHLIPLLSGRVPRSIGAALAFDGEVNLMPLIEELQTMGHSIYLPILRQDKSLGFARWTPSTRMICNQFDILEPVETDVFGVDALEILLVPLVGVDKQGNRMGMGGGYYDRTLAKTLKRPYLMGVAHQCQLVEVLPVQPWDVPLDGLATEEGLLFWKPWY